MTDYGEIRMVGGELKSKAPLVIEGFPGIGLIGNIVSQHIIEELKMDYVGTFNSPLFLPLAVVYEGVIRNPVRIFESAEHDVVTVFSEIPVSNEASHTIGMKLVDWGQEIGVSEFLSVAGIATPGEEERVFVASTSTEALESLKDDTTLFEIGSITGVSGVAMRECLNRDITGLCLLGETHTPNPNPRAAANVVNVISKRWNLDVDTKPLLEQAEKIEKTLHQLSQQMEEAAEAKEKPGPADYSLYG